MSTFSWLYYDATQARRAAELLKALDEPETLDSIGIGAVRDGLADLLFPGTSTIQTRVRYFLIVPWSLLHVAEKNPRTRRQYDEGLREIEVNVIGSLLADSNEQEKNLGSKARVKGIIGRNSRSRTIRMPSTVYWPALEQWGIRTAHLTASDYRESVLSRRPRQLVDDEGGDASPFIVFDEIPSAPDGFPSEPMSMLPTLGESEYLLTRMQGTTVGGLRNGHPAAPSEPSLLAQIAKQPTLATADAPWLLNSLPVRLTPLVLETLDHAEMFSLIIQGARLRYVQLLFDAKRREGTEIPPNEEDVRELVSGWIDRIDGLRSKVAGWTEHISHFFEFLHAHGVAVGQQTQQFIEAWCGAVTVGPGKAMTSGRTAELIIDREGRLKGPNARLSNSSPLGAWDGALFGSKALDFRWSTAQRMLLDCAAATSVGEVHDVVA